MAKRHRDSVTGETVKPEYAAANKLTTQSETVRPRSRSSIFAQRLKAATKHLRWISETDSGIKVFRGRQARIVSVEALLKQIRHRKNIEVVERDAETLLTNQAIADVRFEKVIDLFGAGLTEVKGFAVGKKQIRLYIVGLDPDGNLTGIVVKTTET